MAIYFCEISLRCRSPLGVQPNIIGGQSTAHVAFTTLYQISQNLGTAIDVLLRILEVLLAAEVSPVSRSDLSGPDGPNMGANIFTEGTLRQHQTRKQFRLKLLPLRRFDDPTRKFGRWMQADSEALLQL